MPFLGLYLLAGLLFVLMALSGSILKRLPLSTSLVYLVVGIAVGNRGLDLINIDIISNAVLIERLTEVAVIVSLFTAGLKLRVPWRDRLWLIPARLASVSMVLTIGLITLVGTVGLGLPLGAAILLGAVLAPTDPVLASEVQVSDLDDRDRLRFGLTGEAGLNDGTAFPFVMLGLGLLGHHELGDFGWRWIGIDLVWATVGGLAIGALLGTGVSQLVLFLRQRHKEAVGLDDVLTLGLIALAYGVALLFHAYGFLAVFAAGLALRRIERVTSETAPNDITLSVESNANHELAVKPETAPAYMAQAILGFNEQLERIGEIVVVVLVGALLIPSTFSGDARWFVPLLILVIRPLAVMIGLVGSKTRLQQRHLMAWFGIRGIGSLYYLSYAIVHHLEEDVARDISNLVLATIAVSVVIHGISVTPLMSRYEERRPSRSTS